MARRQELGHPLGINPPPADPEPVTVQPEASTSGLTNHSAYFVLESGSEELPLDDVMTAVQQLRSVHYGKTSTVVLLWKYCFTSFTSHPACLHAWASACRLSAVCKAGRSCAQIWHTVQSRVHDLQYFFIHLLEAEHLPYAVSMTG